MSNKDTQIIDPSPEITQFFSEKLSETNNFLSNFLFFDVFGFPFVVLWLLVGGIFFTIHLKFINFRFFGHAIQTVRGKYSKESDSGEINHFQALSSAISATVGLGNIAGVAIAISKGGPGAVIWMVIAGFLGMSLKFSEVTMGVKYRKIQDKGKISGGAFYYLKDGLKDKNFFGISLKKTGSVLAIIFAFLCIFGSLGGGNMFQSNQAILMAKDAFQMGDSGVIAASIILSLVIALVLVGGIKRIAKVAQIIVPVMAIIYVAACIVVVFVNSEFLLEAIKLIFSEAFSTEAATGGIIGAIVAGITRSAFSNEAGIGSAPIAHSASKTSEPVRAGAVAILEPFIDTIIVCFATGIVIVTTNAYLGAEDSVANAGVLMTSNAFATVISWFPYVLSLAVILFAFSTMITWSYYGERSFGYLFGKKYCWIFQVIFCLCVFIGGVSNASAVIILSEYLILAMCLPNLVGLYLLSKEISQDTKIYIEKLKAGKFEKNEI